MKNTADGLIVYGANGYSANLIIDELISRGIKPILAGRNYRNVKAAAEYYGCAFKIFDLDSPAAIDNALENIHTLINCAGPFKFTAKEILESCIRTSTNYIDITGEIPVFHLAFAFNNKARDAGITILPGAGFDIVPTDCLAKRLKDKLPAAVKLELGFLNKGGSISRGTLLTSLDFMGGKSYSRIDSRLAESEIGNFYTIVRKNNFHFYGISIPWGDVYTAFYSTGIPNCVVYLGVHPLLFYLRRVFLPCLRILRYETAKNFVSKMITKNVTGPGKAARDSAKTFIWGRVEDANGNYYEEAYRIMEGYNLTAKAAAEIAQRVLRNDVEPGTCTPSMAFGGDFLNLFVLEKII